MEDNGLTARLSAALAGTWQPLPGSVAADLAIHHRDGRSGMETRADLQRLARLGLRLQGLWWIEQLDAGAGTLSGGDRQWIDFYWAEMGVGRQPFSST